MAMKAAVTAVMLAAKPRVFNRLCTTSSFNFMPSQISSEQPTRPASDPNPNLYVSGLSKRTTTDGLREAFSKYGEVVHAKVVTDRVSGFSKGFGFVKYATTEEATAGIEGLHGKCEEYTLLCFLGSITESWPPVPRWLGNFRGVCTSTSAPKSAAK